MIPCMSAHFGWATDTESGKFGSLRFSAVTVYSHSQTCALGTSMVNAAVSSCCVKARKTGTKPVLFGDHVPFVPIPLYAAPTPFPAFLSRFRYLRRCHNFTAAYRRQTAIDRQRNAVRNEPRRTIGKREM